MNCAAFPDSLLEAELFGHSRGAFTGAFQSRTGMFKAADGGTLFLDEVNALSLAAQAKLLRVLHDGTLSCRRSRTQRSRVDVRVISATNRELGPLVADGLFREDIYYRIKVLDLRIPPLRERAGDLSLLVAYFLDKHAPDGRWPTLSPAAWAALSQHPFPGNVRELGHAIRHGIALSRGFEIGLEHLPRESDHDEARAARRGDPARCPRSRLRCASSSASTCCAHSRSRVATRHVAARLLGTSRKCLWEKLRRFDLGS